MSQNCLLPQQRRLEVFFPENNKKQFIIMLDTFHFQKNLLKTEYDNLVVLRDIILNRIYFDY